MKTLKAIMVTMLIAIAPQAFAQDGEGLFKSKCSTCHSLKKNSTGPMLQGVKAKWEDAGEGDLLYEWVKNSNNLIAAGNSSMAKSIMNFSPSSMTPQQVSNEEVDAILSYIDNWVPPPPTSDRPPQEGGTEIVYVADYEWNLNMFYILLTLMIVLLICIIVMSGTVTRMIKSDFFQKKLRERNNTLNTLLLIGLFVGMSTSSFALEFNGPGEAEEGQPWLLIENIDLYVLLTINIILVGVLVYIRRMFNTFISMTKAPKAEEEVVEEDVMKKVNQILTDVVPIEEEHTILMDHEYDGIRELDNNLPPWWVWMFYGTIVFAVVYLFHFHILGTGDLQEAEYNKEMKVENAKVEAYLKKMAMNVDETNATMMIEASDINAGKSIFSQNCATCHNPDGEGISGSGPNLTDKYWIYGYDIKEVFGTVKNGRPGGMPEHKSKLTPIQIQQVASFVLQLPEKDGVEPNGDIVEVEGEEKKDE